MTARQPDTLHTQGVAEMEVFVLERELLIQSLCLDMTEFAPKHIHAKATPFKVL